MEGKIVNRRYRRPPGRTLIAGAMVTLLATATLAATPAGAATNQNWKSYLEQPRNPDVKPVGATVLSGDVTNAKGITAQGSGTTTLTVPRGGKPAAVLLDYGTEVEGTPFITVKSYNGDGTTPTMSLAFTEARSYLNTPGSGTLATAAAADATSATMARTSTFAAGDTVTLGSPTETDHIASVSGTTLTLTAPLAETHPAGATVTSTPGAITGDSAFAPRTTTITVDADSSLSGGSMGGLRFEAITLSSPGTVVLKGAGIQFGEGFLATAADYQGYFTSSDDAFNQMFYDGAYTEQTDMQPAGVNGATEPSVLDGAKRDRAIWSGDLGIEGQGIADTLGSNGDDYVKQSLLTLITASPQTGGLNADTLGRNGPYSSSYSHWTLDAAVGYYRNTGDTAFAQQILPWVEGQLAYDATLTDDTGLVVTGSQISTTNGGYDWDFYDGSKPGVVTAYNVLYYRALQDAAYLESNLGNAAKADAYAATADSVRNAINANLFNPATGTYYLSESDHTTLAQDANSLAVVFGVAPTSADAGILTALKALWGPHGSEPYSGTTYSNLISPYITAFEVEADYTAGDTADAEQLIELTWGQMIDPADPFYTGTFWENIGPDGTATESRTSLSHGWASGPTPIMTGYVLGVQPAGPGYSTFTVTPHYGSLASAQGAVPTPYGQILVSWKKNADKYSLTIQAPPGTTATVVLPGGTRTTIKGGAHGTQRTLTN
jgi:hypothetical protein